MLVYFVCISVKQQLLFLTCISDDHDRYLPLREVIIYPLVQSRYVLQNRVRQNNGSQLEWPMVREPQSQPMSFSYVAWE